MPLIISIKQGLKKTYPVEKGKRAKGDPYSMAERRSPRSKRGMNAPPPPSEKKPPTQRRTRRGEPSAIVRIYKRKEGLAVVLSSAS